MVAHSTSYWFYLKTLKSHDFKNNNLKNECNKLTNKQNNNIDNLQLMTESEHIKLHHKDGDYIRDEKGRIRNGK